jgi:hypothetical protein
MSAVSSLTTRTETAFGAAEAIFARENCRLVKDEFLRLDK